MISEYKTVGTSMEDPTFSRAIRENYVRILRNAVREFRGKALSIKKEPKKEIAAFTDTSYDYARYVRSLDTQIGRRSMEAITRAIQHMMLHGTNLARRQIQIPPRPRFHGQFINRGTFLELSHVNVDLVTSVNQRYKDRLKLLVARSLGSGKLTWNQFVKGIKALGVASDRQAEQIARTETVRAIVLAQGEEYNRNGISVWKWVTQKDERVCEVCGPLHGKQVPVGDPFVISGGVPITSPPAHTNCRCGVSK